MHARRTYIDRRIPTMPGRTTSGFHLPGRHLRAPSAKRVVVFGESRKEGRRGSLVSFMPVACSDGQ